MQCSRCMAAIQLTATHCSLCGQPIYAPKIAVSRFGAWLEELPWGAGMCIRISLLSSVFILIGWSRHVFFTPVDTVVSFNHAALAWALTGAILIAGTIVPMFYSLASLFSPQRWQISLWVIIAATLPLLSHVSVQFYLAQIKRISFG